MIDYLTKTIECAKAQNAKYINIPIETLEAISRRMQADSSKIEELRTHIGNLHGNAVGYLIKGTNPRYENGKLVRAIKDAISALGCVEDADGLKCQSILYKALQEFAESNPTDQRPQGPLDSVVGRDVTKEQGI